MDSYTSSSDSSCDDGDRDGLRTLDASGRLLDDAALSAALVERFDKDLPSPKTGGSREEDVRRRYETALLGGNRMRRLPDALLYMRNLRSLDASSARLAELPESLAAACPRLAALTLKNNRLRSDRGLPKTFPPELRELNMSGNALDTVPEQLFELGALRYLYLGANRIKQVPRDISKMHSLQILALGGNKIEDIPESVGQLKNLQMLVLNDNLIEQLPASIGKLNHLRTLLLHKNRLRTLPTEIITLKCLTELSLRDNPLVVRFVRDIMLQPPSLLELSARSIKLHNFEFQPGDIPATLFEYLNSAHHCVNPKCRGVYFDTRVEHVKFVDFCGKYRLPLMQYLCSSKCIVGRWESRETDSITRGDMMKKVLLG